MSTRARCVHALVHRRWSSHAPVAPSALQSKKFSANIDFVNYLLTWAYIIEMVSARASLPARRVRHRRALRFAPRRAQGIKFLGMGTWNYFGDKFNVFDFLINMISIVEIILVAAACVPHATAHAQSRSVVMPRVGCSRRAGATPTTCPSMPPCSVSFA